MSSETLTTLIIVGISFVYIGLERAFPFDKGQKLFRDGFWTDLIGYGIIQSTILGVVISRFIKYIDYQTTWSRLQLVSSWPIWVQCLFFFVLHDLYIYGFHRMQHRFGILWRIHEAHHSAKQIDWMAGTRSHSIEILINQTIEFAPIVLLGGAPEVALFKGIIDAVWGMYIHSNLNVKMGWLQYIFNGPEMHRWHHSADIGYPGVNFATKIAIWDWIFGTAYLPKDKRPTEYGLTDVDFPKGYVAQHLFAFRKMTD